MKNKLLTLKSFNWRLYIALCALALVPAVYQTIKTFLISTNAQEGAFNIIGQMEWFDLINETLQAFLIIPLYSVLSKIMKNGKEEFPKVTFKVGLVAFLLYTIFSVGVLFYGSHLLKAMSAYVTNMAVVKTYLALETVAFMFGIIISFLNVVFVVVGKDKNVYMFLISKTVLSVISDFIMIPKFGVYGVALSNIIINVLLSAISIWILHKQKLISFSNFEKSDMNIFTDWGKVGVFSGLQQFIDNFVYAIMICKMVNIVANQGDYWVANNFIWGWMLIPVTALCEVIRSDCKNGYKKLRQFNYYFITGGVIVLWMISIPLWKTFFSNIEKLSNADEIFKITIKLMPFYIAYAGSVIIDNIFIGLGKTIYNVINSLIVNIVYYGTFYILYFTKVITFDMNTIILMFGLGMIVHWIVSIAEQRIFTRKVK